jgi:hypothetical protein
MLRDWIESEEDQDQNKIHSVEACPPACMKCRPLGCKKPRELISQLKKKEAMSLLNSVLTLLAISEEAKRLELTDEMRVELCDTNPRLPSLLAVFTHEDAVEGMLRRRGAKIVGPISFLANDQKSSRCNRNYYFESWRTD